jgi:N-carbamoyl-L-amino-acid hydrolase
MRYSNCAILVAVVLVGASAAEEASMRVNGERLIQRFDDLSRYGMNAGGGMDRVAFSDADIESRPYLKKSMEAAGLEVRVDEAGNIFGRRPGSEPDLPPIVFGSHTDSVPNGGKYDGPVGSLSAIEVAHVLNENEIVTRHPLDVVIFTDEEGGLVGSKALIGELSEGALQQVSQSGKTIAEGIAAIGGNPGQLVNMIRSKGEVAAYIEVHIEQGRILSTENIDIGVVEGIVGISWWDVTIEGAANHAGTTPMNMRKDALLAASELVLAVNRVVTSVPGSQVGTVGRIRAEPGAPNVIPGKVVMSLELRDLSETKVEDLFASIQHEAELIARETETTITFSPIETSAVPALTEPRIRDAIDGAAKKLGLSFKRMPSGAGHDAQSMAKIAPIGMIFIPSVDGISHSPKEFSHPTDIENGANVLLHTILEIDRGL